MADETADALRGEINHLRRLAQLVADAQVRAEIQKMIEELERRLQERDARLDGLRGFSGCRHEDGQPVRAGRQDHPRFLRWIPGPAVREIVPLI